MSASTLLQEEKDKFLMSIDSIEDLYNIKILLAYARGSRMYGTATETSDVDISFIYIQPTEEILKVNHVEYIDLDGKGNIVGYEIQRYIELLTLNNPNILESLDIPEDCLIYKHESMDVFKQEDWLSKLTEKTILGYADSQIKKATGLNKNMNNPQPKERKSILEFCYILAWGKSIPFSEWYQEFVSENLEYYSKEHLDYNNWGLAKYDNGKGLFALYTNITDNDNMRGLIKDNDSTQLRTSTIPKNVMSGQEPFTLWYNLDGFEVHCKQHKAYWAWVEERNEERHKVNAKHGKNYDSKNMMHLFRLLEMAFGIAINNRIVTRSGDSEDIEYLHEIRAGKLEYDNLMKNAEWLFHTVKEHYLLNEELPDKPSEDLGKEILLKFRKNNLLWKID